MLHIMVCSWVTELSFSGGVLYIVNMLVLGNNHMWLISSIKQYSTTKIYTYAKTTFLQPPISTFRHSSLGWALDDRELLAAEDVGRQVFLLPLMHPWRTFPKQTVLPWEVWRMGGSWRFWVDFGGCVLRVGRYILGVVKKVDLTRTNTDTVIIR